MEVWWLEQSTADVPAANDWLSPREKLWLDALRFPKRRTDWRLGRWTAKRAVADYLEVVCDPEMMARIEIRPALSGAPEVFLENHPAQVSISISHRADIGVCAVAPFDMTIGCDIELVEARSDAFLADYFTEGEHAQVVRAPTVERNVLSNLIWSAKESALKALKVGLRYDTCSLEVSLGETAVNGVLKDEAVSNLPDASYQATGWRPLTVRRRSGRPIRGWWMSADDMVQTIVTFPPSTAAKILSAYPLSS